MMAQSTTTCPICGYSPLSKPFEEGPRRSLVNCPNCGEHELSDSALMDLQAERAAGHRALIAFAVRKLPARAMVTTRFLQAVDLSGTPLPPALERIDNLVMYLATEVEPGTFAQLHVPAMKARLGAASDDAVDWVINQAAKLGYAEVGASNTAMRGDAMIWRRPTALAAKGWERNEELLRRGSGSRHAFMAMKFGDAQMDRVFAAIRAAVELTDFELRTTAGAHATAGSIDNRMRVEIRTSRFLVCDLTHGNRGAYWEAGFAEGIGRPVFYTCRRDVLPKSADDGGPHFDTRQQLIIPWAEATLASDLQALKDAIRATLPAEARQED